MKTNNNLFESGLMDLVELKHAQLKTDFERFRVVDPRSEARMRQSIREHGQLSPVLAGWFEQDQTWVLVDGFKRFRATQAHKVERLKVCRVQRSMQALKAMILTVDREESPCKELEESLVIQSLHRQDGLRQQEIALLCNRHKSWVCRRIAMIERLSDEVVEQVRLGLLGPSVARELVRLPRGNQNEVLRIIHDHRLTYQQSHRLVDVFLARPAWGRRALLENPEPLIDEARCPRLDCGVFTPAALRLRQESASLGTQMGQRGVGSLTHEQSVSLRNTLDQVGTQCASCLRQLAHHTAAQTQ